MKNSFKIYIVENNFSFDTKGEEDHYTVVKAVLFINAYNLDWAKHYARIEAERLGLDIGIVSDTNPYSDRDVLTLSEMKGAPEISFETC